MTNQKTRIASTLSRLKKRLEEMQDENRECFKIVENNNRRNDECLRILKHNNEVIACVCNNLSAAGSQIENLENGLIIIPDPIKGHTYNKIA